MSYASKYAAIATVAWFIILISLILLVVIPGAVQFANPEYSTFRLLVAMIILPGFALNAWIGYKSKKGRISGQIDERDLAIENKASQITLIVISITIFLGSLLLYETHEQTGLVSRGWLYLMAYGLVALISFTHAASSLIFDHIGWTDA